MKGHRIERESIGGIITRDVDIAHIVSGIEVVRNNVEARCQVIRGELPYNVLIGIPLHQNKEDIDLSVLNTITTTTGVEEVREFESSLSNRKYNATAKIYSAGYVTEVYIND